MEPILADWETFARSIWPHERGDPLEMRDHAEAILRAAVEDMASAQTRQEQSDKSKGHSDYTADPSNLKHASAEHGAERVTSGFQLLEVLAEYRALRASVLKLWRRSKPAAPLEDLDDITRFNESIDQSLARGVASFTEQIDRSRLMFLAILGHDLRNPLAAIKMCARAVHAHTPDDPDVKGLTDGITSSAEAMGGLIEDLLVFSRTRLGEDIPLSLAPVDLASVCQEVAAEVKASHPKVNFQSHCEGEFKGRWDHRRLRQMLSNLLGNAVQHGDRARPIELWLENAPPEVRMTVVNYGEPIPEEILPTIFDPMVRGRGDDDPSSHSNMGLGLYIARAIAKAHGGTVSLESTEKAGTRLTVTLPRTPA